MARWHVATSPELHAHARWVCDQAELRRCGDISDEGVYLRSYSKRAIDNVNFVSFGPSEWMCMAGTLIVDGKMGGDALPEFYRIYVEQGIEAARDRSIGHYAIAIRRGGSVVMFTDEQAALRLFYGSTSDGDHIVSSSLESVVVALGVSDVDSMGLIASVFHADAVGADTLYRGVRRLYGTEAIEIALGTGELTVCNIPRGMDTLSGEGLASIDTAVAEYVQRTRQVFAQIAVQPSVGLNMTGGLDSRTILAALLAERGSPLLMYGVGNSGLTNTKSADLEAARELSRLTNLPLYEMDWGGTQPHKSEQLRKLFKKYGFLYTTYGASDSFLKELEKGIEPYPVLQLGGYSPGFPNMRPWEMGREEYTLDRLVEFFSPYCKHLTPAACEEYRQYLDEAMRQAFSAAPFEFPVTGAKLEQFVLARQHAHIPLMARNLNFFSEFAHYLAPFAIKHLADPLLTMPFEYRQKDAFQLRVVAALAPEVLEVPVFSGGRLFNLDVNRLTAEPMTPLPTAPIAAQSSERVGMARRVWRLLPERVRHAIKRNAHGPVRGMSRGQDGSSVGNCPIREHAANAISAHPLVRGLFQNFDFSYLPRLQDLHMRLFAIDEIRAGVHEPRVAGNGGE